MCDIIANVTYLDNEDFDFSMEYADHVVNLKYIWHNQGRVRVHYQLVKDDKIVFEGKDFWGPMNLSDERIVCELMSFLTARPGDVEKEHFKNYTPLQIEWRDEFAEELGIEFMILEERLIAKEND